MQTTISTLQVELQNNITEYRQQIIDMLHLDEDRFHFTIYEVALQYLSEYCGRNEKLMDALTRSKRFWNWWRNQWAHRDKIFIEQLKGDEIGLSQRLQLYASLNNAVALASELSIPSILLREFSPIIKAAI